ncbi:MAG: DUF3352 domain-containing protein [Prochloraceae cyanobacterium]|nr:DUF3352 domain-containing protein [Prochloraceae cyanobacterium]
MSGNKNKTGIVIGAVAIAAIGGGYLLFRGWSKGSSLTPLQAAEIIPQDALFAGYFSTNSESWTKLDKFGTSEFKKLVVEPAKKQLEEASKENSATEDIDYEKDIKPWLGNIMLAALPSKAEEPEVLLVIGIKDKVAALKFMDKLKKEAEDTIQTSEYKGFTIIETTKDSEDPYNIAILDDKIVLAPEKETVKTAIDTYKGSASFADKKGAKEILSQTNKNSDTLFQFYIPDYTGLLKQSLRASGEDLADFKSIEKQLDYVDSMVLSIGVKENRGILMETIVKLNPDANIPKYPNIPGKILSKIPGDSLLLISSGGIAQSWTWFVDRFGEDPDFKEGLNIARDSLKETTELDLDKDIIGWMDGEIAISINPSQTPPAPVNGAIVIATSDRPTAENAIDKFEEFAKSNGAPISKKEVAGKEVTEYESYPGQVVLAYGWLDNKSLAISIADKADRIISLEPSESIAQNEAFKNSIKDFSKQNYGYFYLNFKEVNVIVSQFARDFGQPIPPEAEAVLNSVKAIAGVTTMPDSLTAKQELLIELETSE